MKNNLRLFALLLPIFLSILVGVAFVVGNARLSATPKSSATERDNLTIESDKIKSTQKKIVAPKTDNDIRIDMVEMDSKSHPVSNKKNSVDKASDTYKNIFFAWRAMSKRFKEEVIIDDSNVADFKNDLDLALEAESSFPSNDKSLYYLIDKKHNVGSDYVPEGLVKLTQNAHFNINRNDLSLRPDVFESLKKMADAARADGVTLLVSSTYRSYDYQKALFDKWVRLDGLEEAERESARAGTSQHQMGSAIDFGSITDDFADTKMGKWMYKNASKFGWSLSFPKGYEDITGYRWESWHFRYVGPAASALQKKWFCDVQQYMLEYIAEYKKISF